MSAEREALLKLALIPGLGPLLAARLQAAFGSYHAIFTQRMDALQAVEGIGPERARRLCDPRLDERLRAELAEAAAAGVRIIVRGDPEWPKDLACLPDPPLALWVQGELLPQDRLAVAVVGPRRATAYGHRTAQRLAGGLARLGATIVSGLARGIDTAAHEAALAAGGRTIAVLGSGIAYCYPTENRPLAARIAAGHGAVISELPLSMPPNPGTFPRRNRLVAALSLATLVVEAGATSGALITARLAAELGKHVFAVPGPIDRPEHVGANRLIRDGAVLVTGVEDIVQELAPLATLARLSPPPAVEEGAQHSLSSRERSLWQLLGDEPLAIDDLVQRTGWPASAVSATLLSLELKRLARRVPGGYRRAD
ncbi:MAG: DNA-processing protein DprA [Planctomycetota bacterium]|nr:DNA-processing protein DprA [Planctomycetota bacterium]MDW8373089.1 DNA-processing protein DprA [Planctomycetota bacterium]